MGLIRGSQAGDEDLHFGTSDSEVGSHCTCAMEAHSMVHGLLYLHLRLSAPKKENKTLQQNPEWGESSPHTALGVLLHGLVIAV